ncbi:MAG: hypothetical protein MJ147_06040 [Clostridia bacterium]|nr:hypothetical protein [Clostridia bacterium]
MKRATAIICAVVFIVLMFSGCKNNVFVDDLGNTHKVEMKHGKPVQDKYGNMIEKYTDENGEKQEAVVTFPVAKMDGKHAIESAFIKMNIPDGWFFNENVKVFRIQHKDCPDENTCEITVETNDKYTLDEMYNRDIAAKQAIEIATGDSEAATDFKESTTKLFGKDAKSFTCKIYDKSTFYYYIFSYKHVTVSVNFILNNQCIKAGFDPEQFIKENISLKKIPTE